MYRAKLSFTTNTYDVRKNQILADDFTTQDQIQEYLAIGYIEVYDGTLEITENGLYNVTDYENADVDVAGGQPNLEEYSLSIDRLGNGVITPSQGYDGFSSVTWETLIPFQDKAVTITENGTTTVQADQNYDGLDTVTITTNVPATGVPDWSQIGYSSTPQGLLDDFAYSVEIKNAYRTMWTNISYLYQRDYFLVYMPLVDTSGATNMNYLFSECNRLISIPLLDTHNVTTMNHMFNGCKYLKSIPLFNMEKNTDTSAMFYGCSELTNIPNFDTSNVTNFNQMFYNCTKLVTIPVLNTNKCINLNGIFTGCNSLSNESLNNIMAMCIGTTSEYVGQKKLSFIGLTSAQATICQGLSNYQAFIDAGWTTGY